MAKFRNRGGGWGGADGASGPSGWSGGEPERREICPTSGKQMYPSEADAQATAAHQMKTQAQSKTEVVKLRVYLCIYCECWHLTSK